MGCGGVVFDFFFSSQLRSAFFSLLFLMERKMEMKRHEFSLRPELAERRFRLSLFFAWVAED